MAALKPRVTIVTAGHLSTCPRMVKAADALHAAGYRIRVVSVNHTPWATATDRAVMATRRWEWTAVDYARTTARTMQIATGARLRAARAVSVIAGPMRTPVAAAIRAIGRAHDELARAAAAAPADFVYGGTTGALAAVAESADRLRAPFALDLEDFHSAEGGGADGARLGALVERVEHDVLGRARFLTASSPMIAAAYEQKYGVTPITVHNTFPLAPPRPTANHGGPLRLYWFSQTLGPGRGLNELVRALALLATPVELHLRGRPKGDYVAELAAEQRVIAPRVALRLHDPAAPDDMVRLAQDYDAGFSGEERDVFNHRLCLGNKIFTYLAAGTPVILSRTPAQTALAADIGRAALTYECGDVAGLAKILAPLAADVESRQEARAAAGAAAERRWHWEHPADRGALVGAVTHATC
jgi:glycosyltransferase involved in cell wall biosynthesis